MTDSPLSLRAPPASLDAVLADEALALLFRDFLHDQRSAENLAFWLEVQHWRETCADGVAVLEQLEGAEAIVSRFISQDATYGEVNVDDGMRERILNAVEGYSKNVRSGKVNDIPVSLFDEVCEWVFDLMQMDSFRKFLKSPRLLQWQQEPAITVDANEKEPKRQKGWRALLGLKHDRRRPLNTNARGDVISRHPRTQSVLLLQQYARKHANDDGSIVVDSPDTAKSPISLIEDDEDESSVEDLINNLRVAGDENPTNDSAHASKLSPSNKSSGKRSKSSTPHHSPRHDKSEDRPAKSEKHKSEKRDRDRDREKDKDKVKEKDGEKERDKDRERSPDKGEKSEKEKSKERSDKLEKGDKADSLALPKSRRPKKSKHRSADSSPRSTFS